MSTAINNYHATDGPKFKNKSEIRWAGKPAAVPAHDLIWKGALWRRALSHVIRAVRARHENAPLRMPQKFAHLFLVLFWIYSRLHLSRQIMWPYHCGVWKDKKGAFGVRAKVRQHE